MLAAESVLVLAPHADDETLGAGGTLCRLKKAGAALHWLLMTSPEGAGYTEAYVEAHTNQVDAVANGYPFDTVHHFRYPASALARQSLCELVDRLRDLAAEIQPDLVLLPHRGDAHDDHGATARAAWAAFKGFRMREFGVRGIYAMEILSETDAVLGPPEAAFIPNTVVDISAELNRKLSIFSLYKTEAIEGGPRSTAAIRAQAVVNGAAYGISAAERFMCLHQRF